MATFICDIVALYVHRQSDVYRQQKFQDVDLNLLRLETLNTLPISMMSEESKRKHENHIEGTIANQHITDRPDITSTLEDLSVGKYQRERSNHHDLYDDGSLTSKDTNNQSTPMLIYGNYHQQRLGLTNNLNDNSPITSVKQRRATNNRPSQLALISNEKNQFFDKTNIVFVDEDSPDVISDQNLRRPLTEGTPKIDNHSPSNFVQTTRLPAKIETFL